MNNITKQEILNNIKEWLKDSVVRGALIISIFAICISFIFKDAYFEGKSMDNVISVTGSARRSVVADTAKLSLYMRRNTTLFDLGEGYKIINKNSEQIKDILIKSGFTEEEISITPASANQIYDGNNLSSANPKYDLTFSVELISKDIDKVVKLSKEITSNNINGLVMEIRPVEYIYTKIAEIRTELFSEAMKDAKTRADAIAKTSKRKVGKIRNASTGIVQILQPNSSDVSDYGTVDTSSLKKDVMITARASFFIK